MSETDEQQPNKPSRLGTGCLGLGVVLVVVPLAFAGWWSWSAGQAEKQAATAQEEKAEALFEPAMEAMKPQDAGPDYDIDKTIRVIHEIDLALAEEQDFEAYIDAVTGQDYRDVAPEIMEARSRILDLQMQLYAKQVRADDQKAAWELTSELLLSTLSVVSVSGEADMLVSGSFEVDRAQAKQLLTDLKEDQQAHDKLVRDITALETQLFSELMAYSEVYYDYVEEWDQLSVLRDRAYLAAHNGDWEAARASADLAMEKAPMEREAHLLKAMAMIEQDKPEEDAAVVKLLSDYIESHPERSAPAFLLLGVQHEKQGRLDEAQLAFQQSAAYYPKQAEALTDMLDPYEMRSFLTRSREGEFITRLYTSTMLGAGYFSPDLQMARMAFDQGDEESGRAKVLDHFARRRAQKQWEFILSDIQFCHDVLGPHFWKIFPEESYLDLEVSPTMWGGGINLSVNNRSPKTLHNATLVLALHFTDQYPGQYETLTAEETVPAVKANTSTSFGALTIDVDVDGMKKGVEDIVQHRAILVTDEAVSWVDTDEFKIAEAEAFRSRKRMAEKSEEKAVAHPLAERHPEFEGTVERLVKDAGNTASLELETKYGADNVLIELPKELAILRPVFRLRHGDDVFTADDNLIEGDSIQLRFAGVENFDEADRDELELLVASPFGDVVFQWSPGGDLTWRYGGFSE